MYKHSSTTDSRSCSHLKIQFRRLHGAGPETCDEPETDRDDHHNEDSFPNESFQVPDLPVQHVESSWGSQPQVSSQTRLVDEPSQITTTHINYAKKSNNVDIEKLKSSLWQDIQVKGMPGEASANGVLQESVSFDAVLETLPAKLPPDQVNEASVPLAFICLLELANKKKLQIDQSGSDLFISSYVS